MVVLGYDLDNLMSPEQQIYWFEFAPTADAWYKGYS